MTNLCARCDGSGWCCEDHPHLPMRHGGCDGAGAPCWCPVDQAITQRLDQQRVQGGATLSAARPNMTADESDRFAWNYKPKAQRLEPVTLAPPLWTRTKNGHTATAHVKAIDGVGLELRFLIDAELRHSQLFRDWSSLEQAAREKRSDFEQRGWREATRV